MKKPRKEYTRRKVSEKDEEEERRKREKERERKRNLVKELIRSVKVGEGQFMYEKWPFSQEPDGEFLCGSCDYKRLKKYQVTLPPTSGPNT